MITFECPTCGGMIEVAENEVNCRIFRHGVLKSNMQQINPHSREAECKHYVANELIYGCGYPFQLTPLPNGQWTVNKTNFDS